MLLRTFLLMHYVYLSNFSPIPDGKAERIKLSCFVILNNSSYTHISKLDYSLKQDPTNLVMKYQSFSRLLCLSSCILSTALNQQSRSIFIFTPLNIFSCLFVASILLFFVKVVFPSFFAITSSSQQKQPRTCIEDNLKAIEFAYLNKIILQIVTLLYHHYNSLIKLRLPFKLQKIPFSQKKNG